MKNGVNLIIAGVIGLVIIGGVVALLNSRQKIAQVNPASQAAETVKIASKTGLGSFLTDSKGMTLYYFPKDTIGKSNCEGQCLAAWPIFYSAQVQVPSGLKKEDFGTIAHASGAKQSTYKGWPLYYYFKDSKPGDTLGEDVGHVWYVVKIPFYTVMFANKEKIGNYLVDENGRALYRFTKDTKGADVAPPKSACTGACKTVWPVFHTATLVIPSVLKTSDFAQFARTDGTTQLAYKGSPLYYYVQDTSPGDTKGDGVNNVWFLAKP